MPHEVELKFDLDPGDVSRVREAPALCHAAGEARVYDTLYYDTPDRALRRAGYSLRVRGSGDRFVQTVKQKSNGSVGLFVRREWEAEVGGFAPSPSLLKKSAIWRTLSRNRADALVPLASTRICRRRWMIEHRASRIEVVLDEGHVISGECEAPICELELELIDGRADDLFDLARQLAATVPLRLSVLSKGDRGYALAEGQLGRAARADPVRIAPGISEGEAFRAVASSCLRHFRLNEIALLSGQRDAEALHQARVAIRRLRSALALFRPTLAGKDHHGLRDELKWLAGKFGAARNLDVLLARAAGSPGADLRRRREKAYDRVLAALRSPRACALFLRLSTWIEGGAWRYRRRAAADVGLLAERQLDRQWGRVARRGARLAELDARAQHDLRLDVKKLRYSAEFLADLYAGKSSRRDRDRFLAAVKALQERLGELNDAQLDPSLATPRKTIKAVQQAFHRASISAGYWRTAT